MRARKFAQRLPGTLLAVVLAAGSAMAGTVPCLRGVNLAGAEFGDVPGRLGTNYAYPSAKTIQHFAAAGMTVIRLPFLWERLQPQLGSDLDAQEFTALDTAVQTATAAGLHVILDPHNYAHYRGNRIGTAALPTRFFATFWRRLSWRYRANPAVVFSLMNEPYDVPADQWLGAANEAIAAIRATDAKNLILVPGTAYTGLHSWTATLPVGNNGAVMGGVRDSADNLAFDVHQYLDTDASGQSPECSGAAHVGEALDRFEAWLRQHHARAFLGEFGVSSQPACLKGLRTLVEHLNHDPEHWIGWSYWAAGDWWAPDYMFSLQPTPAGDRPQMTVLRALLAGPDGNAARCAGTEMYHGSD